MGADSGAPQLDEYAFDLVARKASQLIGQYGFTKDDEEDIVQDLLADLLHRLPSFDSSRASLHTFINRVVEHAVARIIEHRKAALRDYRQCVCSLNDPVAGEDGEQAERGDLLDQDTYLESLGQSTPSLADQVAAHVDVERMRATLPPEMRTFLDQLGDGQGLLDISRETDTCRGTLWRRLMKLARRAEVEDC